ncbi:hypothetical protein [Empedobacter brevis]|uniref:hypothetical protein n=1 Tax=Empedobacter brevis TaxID=247 RepID=UPI001320509C|nr:hypothetical protein [Empedobacter brevis]QHC85951.1 hypothetical protein AS589_14735 [Empedobacter brevis]
MKKLIILLISLLSIFNCKELDHNNDNKILSQLQNSDFKIFEGVYIKTSNVLDGNKRVSSFIKEFNGNKYHLPNFEYYNCNVGDTICLKIKAKRTFDISKYSLSISEKKNQDYYSTLNDISKIINEFQKLDIYKIYSSTEIGNSIIFFIKDEEYIAYISDFSKIKNEYWKKKISEDEQIDKHWYISR